MKRITTLLAAVAFALLAAVPARATWSVVSSGSSPAQITDGNWTLYLYYNNNAVASSRAKYMSHGGGSTTLDLTTVNDDLEKAGSNLRVTEIDQTGFLNNTIVTKVYLPDYITKLGQKAFQFCSALTTVCISANANFVNTHVFSCCPNLETVYYNGATPETGTVQIPASVTDIKANVFENGGTYNNANTNRKIKKIIAPGITAIQSTAFQSCAALESVYAPKATSIGAYAFQHCVALTDITDVGVSSATSIGAYAFQNCKMLKEIDVSAATSIGGSAFRDCTALETVVISPSLSTLVNGNDLQHFSGCPALKAIYPSGTEPEEGTVRFPSTLTTIPERVFQSNCSSVKKIVAPGVTSVGNRAFGGCTALESVELSTNLVEMKGNSSNWNHGPFHNGDGNFRSSFVHFAPSTFSAAFHTEAPDGYRGTFTYTAITNYLDFSACSTIASIPEYFAYNTCIAGATFPATLTSLANKSFGRIRNAATFRFLGAPPTVSASDGNAPFKNGKKNEDKDSANEIGLRHTFVVEPANVSSWTASGFVSVYDIKTSNDSNVKKFQNAVNNPTDSSYDFPTPEHPEETLGITSWGNQSGNYSWLVKYVDHSTVTATFMDETGTTVLGTTEVEVGNSPSYSGLTPTKASTAQYDYTFIGWNTDSSASTALSDLTISADTTFYAIFSATTRSYTITWKWDNGTDTSTDTTTVAYGETPTHADATKPSDENYSYTFAGWSTDGENVITIPAVTEAATYIAVFQRHDASSTVTVSWFGEDGTTALDPATTTVLKDSRPTHAEPTKDATVDTVYTFAGWKVVGGDDTVYAAADLPLATADVSYKAYFTSATRKYAITFADYDGSEISTELIDYGSEASVVEAAKPADPTRAATAEYTYTFGGWTPAFAAVTGEATYTATYTATANEYTATFVDEDGTTVLKDAVTYAYGDTVVPPDDPTKEGYTFAEWAVNETVVEDFTMPAANTTYTATYAINKYTITWLNANGDALTTTQVEHGSIPAYPGTPVPTMTATAKMSYAFAGIWTPEIEAAVSNTTYTAVYNAAFLSPLAIKRTSAVYDNGAGEATVVTEVVNGGTGAETTAEAAATQRTAKVEGEATVEGTTVTSVFDGFIAGRGYEWTITATQTYGAEFGGVSESASIKGRTYARKSRTWFECSPVEWNDGVFAPGSASGSGAQVRLHATVTFPAILPRALLEGGNAVVGITAYQPNAGVAPCYYAWDGAQWVRLAGVAPKGGVAVKLLGVVDFARKDGPAVAWYADGFQLTTAKGDWEVPLAGGTKLTSFGLVGDLTVGSLSGDYDVGGLGFSLIIR